MIKMIHLPVDHDVFTQSIHERCENLIKFGIWDGIDLEVFNIWLNNFRTDEEKYFSALLLDSLIYRSNRQVGAMIFELFSRKIPNEINKKKQNQSYALLDKLKKKYEDPRIRVLPILVGEDTGQSGHVISRVLKRDWICQKWEISPINLETVIDNTGIDTFIIIDDFCGTGEQIDEFIQKYDLVRFTETKEIFFCFALLAAHSVGFNKLKNKYPQFSFTSAELIPLGYSCFNSDIINNAPKTLKEFYNEILKKNGIKRIRKDRLFGRGNLEILYAFQDSVPNNSLGMLYYDESWKPLVKR